MDGWLVVDKPAGVTSRDAVNVVQRWFPRGMKLGHTGTLDPLATGVLVLCLGRATKLADRVQVMGKEYRTIIRLGATSTSDDADGEITESPQPTPPSEIAIREVLTGFVGTIEQLPPAVSALKVNGVRAHALVRAGKEVDVKPRPVRVDSIVLERYAWPEVELTIACGKGTYVRSIARDLGAKLGVGGLVQQLRRTRVGPFTTDNAARLDHAPDQGRSRVQPLGSVEA
jgi:tRNA pseudouridine55 synthase